MNTFSTVSSDCLVVMLSFLSISELHALFRISESFRKHCKKALLLKHDYDEQCPNSSYHVLSLVRNCVNLRSIALPGVCIAIAGSFKKLQRLEILGKNNPHFSVGFRFHLILPQLQELEIRWSKVVDLGGVHCENLMSLYVDAESNDLFGMGMFLRTHR